MCYIYIVKVHAYYNHHGGTCALQLIVVACVLCQRLWIVTVHVHYRIKKLFVVVFCFYVLSATQSHLRRSHIVTHSQLLPPG